MMKSDDDFAEKAEKLHDITHIAKSNSLHHIANNKEAELKSELHCKSSLMFRKVTAISMSAGPYIYNAWFCYQSHSRPETILQ